MMETPAPALSSGARSFVSGVVLLAGGGMIVGVTRGALPSIETIFFWMCAFLVGEVMRFRTPTGKGNVSMAFTIHLAAVPLIPAAALLPAACVARLTADLIVMRSRWYRALFNAAQVTLAVAAATVAFHFFLPEFRAVPPTEYLYFVASLAAAALAYIVVNQGLVSGVLCLVTESRYFTVWRENFGYRVEIVSSIALFLLAPVVSISYQAVGFWSVAAFALPVLFVRDACERYLELERTQRALIGSERLAAKGEMAASVAHEINNLLQIITGNLQLHLHHTQNIPPENRARLDRIQVALEEMRMLSKGLLDFSHQESRLVPIHLGQLVQETVAFVRPQNRFDGITFSTETDDRVGFVLVDPAQIRQVLTNLLFNAADAMADAGTILPRIDVRLTWLASEQEAELTVSDNGPGIPEEARHRIFEPGYTTKEYGHGFGLSTVFRIAKNHKSTIHVQSPVRGGAVFTLRIPALPSGTVLRAA